jgi:putative membrane protein
MHWIKALHIIFMVTWFAGLFYLPRLFVYHALASDAISKERFVLMERKLLFGIMTPGAILTLIFGAWLILSKPFYYSHALWLHAKLLLVFGLVIYHFYCGKFYLAFKHDRNTHSHVFYRWFNEIPVVLLAGIIILVVVKPF